MTAPDTTPSEAVEHIGEALAKWMPFLGYRVLLGDEGGTRLVDRNRPDDFSALAGLLAGVVVPAAEPKCEKPECAIDDDRCGSAVMANTGRCGRGRPIPDGPERAGFYRCAGCRHAPHERPCLNMASDNDCDCPGGLPVEFVSTSPAAEPGGLTAVDRAQIKAAIAAGYYDHTAAEKVAAVVEHILAARAPAREAANPILADALTYYAERRPMNNPKGWDHVLRKVEQGIEAGLWSATSAQIEEARTVLGALATAPARDGLAERA